MFNFDNCVNKAETGNLKYFLTPDTLKRDGIVSYSGAEMEFKTAPSIIASLSDFVSRGAYGFTLCDDKYRSCVAKWMKTQRNFSIEKEWIISTLGTIFSVATTIRLLTKPNEGIIVSPPVYYRYEQAANRLGRKTVYNYLKNNGGKYSIDFENLDELMSKPENKLYILCNPHNPISKVWNKEDLERLAEIANKHGVIIFSDEIFGEVTFGKNTCIPFCTVKGGEKAIVCTSLGKTFNFTGVNHANVIIKDDELRKCFINQRNADHYGSVDPFFYAAINGAYTDEGAKWKDEMVSHVEECFRLIVNFFNLHLPDVIISPLEGTYVIWLDWRKHFNTDESLMEFLKTEASLYTDLGSEYGSEEGFTRLSIAVPFKDLNRSLELLLEAGRKRGIINREGVK